MGNCSTLCGVSDPNATPDSKRINQEEIDGAIKNSESNKENKNPIQQAGKSNSKQIEENDRKNKNYETAGQNNDAIKLKQEEHRNDNPEGEISQNADMFAKSAAHTNKLILSTQGKKSIFLNFR
jgi:hypothetical protein